MTTHIFDFVCEGWVGNYELEFVSYVFNSPDWENERRDYSTLLTPEQKAKTAVVLGEDFLQYFYSEYGDSNVEIGEVPDEFDSADVSAIRVRVDGSTWNRVDQAAAVELMKRRAEEFFPVYLDKLPSYQLREGAYVGLCHTAEIVTTKKEIL